MKTPLRRLRANFYYLRRPLRRFTLLLLAATVVVLLGGICFHELYSHQKMSYGKAFYTTY